MLLGAAGSLWHTEGRRKEKKEHSLEDSTSQGFFMGVPFTRSSQISQQEVILVSILQTIKL